MLTSKTSYAKDPLQSVVLSLLFPGLGHFYLGDVKKAKIFGGIFVASLLLIILCVSFPTEVGDFFLVVALPLVFFYTLFIAFISYRSAVKITPGFCVIFYSQLSKKVLIVIEAFICVFVFNIPLLISKYVTDQIVQVFRISSTSMEPTLPKTGMFLIHKAIYKHHLPEPGDIVIFSSPPKQSRLFIKRIAGRGGDIVEIKQGKVYVNDQLANMPQNIFYTNAGSYGEAGQKVEISMGHYYVLGDNSSVSRDSRFWGFLPQEYIVGKASKFFNY